MSNPCVVTRALTKIYPQGTQEVGALRDVNLTIGTGEFIVLAGPSGSGKTTLLNLIGALDTPTSGSVEIDGASLAAKSDRALARLRLERVGYIFQSYNLLPVLSVYENAEYVLLLQGVSPRERRQRVEAVLESVGLADLAKRRPAELSGGQQQRVAIARAIAAEPSIILADEPTASVDTQTGNELIELMHRLNKDRKVTFVFSSHDPRIIEHAERLIELRDGSVIRDSGAHGG